MKISDALAETKYVVDANGNRTDVVIPLDAWKTLLETWGQLLEALDDQEDAKIIADWLEQRARGEAKTISLDDLEKELTADGLLPH